MQGDTPSSQSQGRRDVFLSSLSDVCQELKSSEARLNTSSHTLSKHDTSRLFIKWPVEGSYEAEKTFDLNVLQVPTTVLQTSKASCDSVMC